TVELRGLAAQRNDVELRHPAFTLAQLALGAAPVTRVLERALVLGAEPLVQLLRFSALVHEEHRGRREYDDDDDDYGQDGTHQTSSPIAGADLRSGETDREDPGQAVPSAASHPRSRTGTQRKRRQASSRPPCGSVTGWTLSVMRWVIRPSAPAC